MKIDIKKVAKLAKLQLTETEETKYSQELEQILEHFELLGEVDTKNVTPTSLSNGLVGRAREDVVKNADINNIQEELLSSSKYHEGSFIKVPPVL